MTSSLEEEGGGSAKRRQIFTIWQGAATSWGLVHHPPRGCLLLQHSGTLCPLFFGFSFVPPVKIFQKSTVLRSWGWASQNMTPWQGGGGGSLDTPRKWWRHLALIVIITPLKVGITKVQSQKKAFTQSPSLSNNLRILDKSLICMD